MRVWVIITLFFIAFLTIAPTARATETVIDNMQCEYGAVAHDDGDTLSGGGCTTLTYHEFVDNYHTASMPLEISGNNRNLELTHESAPNSFTWDSASELIGISKPITLNLSRRLGINISMDLRRYTSGGADSSYYQLCLEDDDGDHNCMTWRSTPTTLTHRYHYYSGFNMSSDASFNNETITKYMLFHRPQSLNGLDDYRLDEIFDNITANWTLEAGGSGPSDPVVTITDPDDGGIYEDVNFQFPVNWDSDQTCTQAYYNYNEEGNVSFNGNITLAKPYDNGQNNITIYCQNSFGGWGLNSSTFNLSVAAYVDIVQPHNVTYIYETITYLFGSNQPVTFIYSIDGEANVTHEPGDITSTGAYSYNNFTVSSGDGLHNITVWANNTLGAWNVDTKWFTTITTGLIILPHYEDGHVFTDTMNIWIGANFTFGSDVRALAWWGMQYDYRCQYGISGFAFYLDSTDVGGNVSKQFWVSSKPEAIPFCIRYFSHDQWSHDRLTFWHTYWVAAGDPSLFNCIQVNLLDKWNNSIIGSFMVYNQTTGYNYTISGASGSWACDLNASSSYIIRAEAGEMRAVTLTGVTYPGTYNIQLDQEVMTSIIHVIVKNNNTLRYIGGAQVSFGDDVFYTGSDGIATFWRPSRITYSGEVSMANFISKHFSIFPEQGVNYRYIFLIPTNATLGFSPPSPGSAKNTFFIIIYIIFLLASAATIKIIWSKYIMPGGG